MAIFGLRDKIKRTVTNINWHPEGPTKIAVSLLPASSRNSGRLSRIGAAMVLVMI